MAKLIVLGSSNAIPSLGHENTHLAIITPRRTLLVDCAANPIVRLEQAGIDFESVTDVILTHFHPDHVAGVPSLLMGMWLLGRRAPLTIYGLAYTVDRAEKMMELYGWDEWPNFFPVNFIRVPETELVLVLDADDMRICASPVIHFLPNIGLRFEFKPEGKSAAYSCDTEPCAALVPLAQGVDVLLHEASGPLKGHSSAAQAGDVAQKAGVGVLYLIHYPTGRFPTGDLVAEARSHFQGEVKLATDFLEIELG
jgi:ribonuclease Z